MLERTSNWLKNILSIKIHSNPWNYNAYDIQRKTVFILKLKK